jgi:hypothetical protein
MLVDAISSTGALPELTTEERTMICYIKASIFKAIIPFKKVLSQPNLKSNPNENDLTQLFVHRVDYQIRKCCANVSVDKQYYDTYFNTKGVPDFYFYKCEEAIDHEALFVVEAKRLPAPKPKKTREKEYVVGGKNNGGIERYKTEKHGKGLYESGMIGFVEQKSCSYWLEKVNSWIEELSQVNTNWEKDEILNPEQGKSSAEYCFLKSIAHRNSGDADIMLYHWWIIYKKDEDEKI